MSRADVSRVVNNSTVNHPFFDVARIMVDAGPELNEISKAVVGHLYGPAKDVKVYTPNLYDFPTLLLKLKEEGHYDKLREIVKKAKAVQKNPGQYLGEHPKPVPYSELVSRVEKDSSIIDIGSGDGRRLIQIQGQLRVSPYEVEEGPWVSDFEPVWKKFVEVTEDVVMSFNSLLNNDEVDFQRIIQNDGVHVIPDLRLLVKDGYSTKEGNVVTTVVKGVTYTDYDHKVPVASLTRTHYKGTNTYKQRTINCNIGEWKRVNMLPMNSFGKRAISRLDPELFDDFSYKLDGELRCVKNKGGRAMIRDRKDKLAVVECDSDVDFDIMLEYYNGNHYLISVNKYRTYKPFHSLSLLEYFLERVIFKVDGKNVRPPMRATDFHANMYEGLVARTKNVDYLYRNHLSIDVKGSSVHRICQMLRDNSYVVHNLYEGDTNQICEFMLEQFENEYELRFHKFRPDKTVEDKDSDIVKMMKWPTLYEISRFSSKRVWENDIDVLSEEE